MPKSRASRAGLGTIAAASVCLALVPRCFAPRCCVRLCCALFGLIVMMRSGILHHTRLVARLSLAATQGARDIAPRFACNVNRAPSHVVRRVALMSEELRAAVAPDPTCSHAARLFDAGLFPHSHLYRPGVNVLRDTSLPPRSGVACGTWRAIPLHACTMVHAFTLFVSACSGATSVPWSSACSTHVVFNL